MPLYKYVANADTTEGTARIKLNPTEDGLERVLVLGGDALELTDAEAALLGGRYQLEEVDAPAKEPSIVDVRSPVASPPSTPSASTPQSTQSTPSTPTAGS